MAGKVSDRVFGLVVTLVALAYIASATQIQSSFLADPVGPRTFPIIIGSVAALCGVLMVLRPDPDPQWPGLGTFFALVFAVVVLVGYAFTLKPLGFLIPTAFAAGILSYQIHPRLATAALSGLGLSLGLYFVFKFVLGLGLVAFGRALIG
ncbi:MAG TPA: tripartite tricarboxylate transporter TctB family protein [Rhodobacteraceae bacterium]|nr:tripartite tricarboxylate transporter TctB family protein [Paracoccaceae bacterium]